MEIIGINDVFPKTGPYDDLLSKFGISVDNIIFKTINLTNN